MMMMKSRSEEKMKPQSVRFKECLTCPRPTNTKIHERDYNRPQPVRIRLLMQDEEKGKAKKSSTKKKILPERLGPLSSRKTSTKEQDNELCTYVKSKNYFSHASRNLDFNNMTTSTVNNKTDNVDQLNKPTNTKQTSTEVHKPQMRISLLAVPNSIKNKYLRGCVKEATKGSKLNVLKENVPLNKKSAVSIYPSKSIDRLEQSIVRHNKNDTTQSQCKITSSECKSGSLNITNQTSASSCKISNAKQLEKDTCSLDENHFKCLGPETVKEDECIKRLCNNLQSTEIIPENGLNTKHTSSEMMCIDRNEFMHLKCELENFISTTEQNLGKVKSILTKLLSTPQKSISQSNISKDSETNIEITFDKEIQIESCELEQPTEENSKFRDSCHDDLENQFDIEHTKPVKKFPSPQNTPVIRKYRQKRSMKEYMSLKSSMSFLQTPDSKLLHQRNNVDEPTTENKSYISTKVLAELQNLYSDSPF